MSIGYFKDYHKIEKHTLTNAPVCKIEMTKALKSKLLGIAVPVLARF